MNNDYKINYYYLVIVDWCDNFKLEIDKFFLLEGVLRIVSIAKALSV
jgi:hypothetical protein